MTLLAFETPQTPRPTLASLPSLGHLRAKPSKKGKGFRFRDREGMGGGGVPSQGARVRVSEPTEADARQLAERSNRSILGRWVGLRRSHAAVMLLKLPFCSQPWSLVHQACSFARQRPSKQTSQSVIEGTERHRNVRMCSVGNASASPRLLFRKTASQQAIFSICGRRRSRRALKCTHLQCLQCKCGYIVSKTVLMLSFHQDTS